MSIVANHVQPAFQIQRLAATANGMEVVWQDGHLSYYADVWLRDSCRCHRCFDATTLMPKAGCNVATLPLHPVISDVEAGPGGNPTVAWRDDPSHVSVFDAAWLRAQCSRTARSQDAPSLWSADVQMDRYHYRDVMQDDEAVLAWLQSIDKTGIALIEDVPQSHGGMRDVMERRVGMLRARYHPTDVYTFDTTDGKSKSANNAYNFDRLAPHTDFTPYADSAVLSALLCLHYENPAHDQRGFSTVVDGFKIAEVMRNEKPEYFRLLTEHPVSFCRRRLTTHESLQDGDQPERYQYESFIKRHVIQVDDERRLRQIVHHDNNRAPFDIPEDKLREFVAAYQCFVSLVRSREHELTFLIQPGEMFTYNNGRVLHGRTELGPDVRRVLIGAAIQEGTWRSRLRILLGRKTGLSDVWLRGCSDESLKMLANRSD